MIRGVEFGVVFAAASTVFSAVLYLFDFATNISTLRTYYKYEYQCPHAPSASPLLADPICSAINSGRILYGSLLFEFWACLVSLVIAHLSYAVVFWYTLDPCKHPFRLAYFLPLLHLYRLLKLLCHTLSCQDIKGLMKAQLETSNLFNAISAYMETASLFFIQFFAAMKLGDQVKGSLDPTFQAQRIPTILIISLLSSLISAGYTTGMAMLPLLKGHMSSTRQAYVCLLMGFHTIAALLERTLCLFGLLHLSTTARYLNSLTIYLIMELLIAWLLLDLFLQSHHYNGQSKNRLTRVACSFGLCVVNRLAGPTYVMVRFSKNTLLIILGAFLHIIVGLIGFFLILYLPSRFQELNSPCHSIHIKHTSLVEENAYVTCKVYISTYILSFSIFVLTTLQIHYIQKGISTKIVASTWTNNLSNTHKKLVLFEIPIIDEVGILSLESKGRNSHQMTKMILLKMLLFVIVAGFIKRLQNTRVV